MGIYTLRLDLLLNLLSLTPSGTSSRCPTDRQTDRQTDVPTYQPTNRPTNDYHRFTTLRAPALASHMFPTPTVSHEPTTS
ncbi:hypothetical protein TMatcc_009057 [Talaromyces marneffei ATCC 18224]